MDNPTATETATQATNPTDLNSAKRKRGRPVGTTGKHTRVKPEKTRVTMWLTVEQAATALRIGGGVAVKGVRKALDIAKIWHN
jgi:hypothetical protein